MKRFLGLFLVTTALSSAFANPVRVFKSTEEFDLRSYGNRESQNVVADSIKIEMLKFAPTEKMAELSVNGATRSVKIKQTKASLELDKYEAIIHSQMIVEGGGCDEEEKLEYTVEITVEKEEYGHSPDVISFSKLKAEQFYSWDLCHDSSYGPVSTINYN